MLDRCTHVLGPPLTSAVQRDSLRLAGLGDKTFVEIDYAEVVQVDELVLPWDAMEDYRPHPGLRDYFTRMKAAVAPSSDLWPRRIYVDRRHGAHRRLVNENEVVTALERTGFVAVRLELLSLEQQISLFRGAECVVAPHGAGLSNLVFAPSGCRVVELQMDQYLQWAFRSLAALSGLDYDCVIGRRLAERDGTLHDQHWAISVIHVMAAVEPAIAR